MRFGLPSGVDQQVLGAARKAEMRARQRLVGAEMLGPAMRRRMRLDRLRIGRLEAEAARGSRPRRSAPAAGAARAPSGSRWNGPRCRAWRGRRPAGRSNRSCRSPCMSVQGWSMVIASSKATRAISAARPRIVVGGDAAFGGDGLRRVFRIEIFLGEQLERRHGVAAVGELVSGRTAPAARPGVPAGTTRSVTRLADQRLAVARRARTGRGRRARRIDRPARARWCSAAR